MNRRQHINTFNLAFLSLCRFLSPSLAHIHTLGDLIRWYTHSCLNLNTQLKRVWHVCACVSANTYLHNVFVFVHYSLNRICRMEIGFQLPFAEAIFIWSIKFLIVFLREKIDEWNMVKIAYKTGKTFKDSFKRRTLLELCGFVLIFHCLPAFYYISLFSYVKRTKNANIYAILLLTLLLFNSYFLS